MTAQGRQHDDAETLVQERISMAVKQIIDRRVVIEQAKGMLMLAYGIDAERAFAVLTWRSQTTNTAIRHLAQQVLEDFGSPEHGMARASFDALLLTSHERIGPAAPTSRC